MIKVTVLSKRVLYYTVLLLKTRVRLGKFVINILLFNVAKQKNLRSDHNLLAMVNEAKYTPNQDESYFLERLTYQVQVLARYSIAKKCSTQSKFTGVIVGGSSHDSQMVHSIIIKVLKDQDLVDIFTYGYLPKPIGE